MKFAGPKQMHYWSRTNIERIYRFLVEESPTEGFNNLACPCFLVSGGDNGDRTHDLCIANAALSQLSYIPTGVKNSQAE